VRAPSPDAGKAQEIAAIRDGDVIGIGHRADRVEDRAGMNFAVGADRLRGSAGSRHALAVLAAQPVGPGGVDSGAAIAGGFHHGPQRQGGGGHLRLATAVVDQLADGIGDARR
jgi:hypothetical protein